jgi:hypothetical protein
MFERGSHKCEWFRKDSGLKVQLAFDSASFLQNLKERYNRHSEFYIVAGFIAVSHPPIVQ